MMISKKKVIVIAKKMAKNVNDRKTRELHDVTWNVIVFLKNNLCSPVTISSEKVIFHNEKGTSWWKDRERYSSGLKAGAEVGEFQRQIRLGNANPRCSRPRLLSKISEQFFIFLIENCLVDNLCCSIVLKSRKFCTIFPWYL